MVDYARQGHRVLSRPHWLDHAIPSRFVAVPRVLYLTDLSSSNKFGSMEEQIFELAKAFDARGGLFLPIFGGEPGATVRRMYADHRLPVEGLDLQRVSLTTLGALLRLITAHEIDVIHWNFYSPINSYVWFLSVLRPSLAQFRTDHNSRWLPRDRPRGGAKRFLKRAIFRKYRRVFGISEFVVSAMRAEGVWHDVARCTYFVNTTRFAPDARARHATRSEYSAESKFVVLFVGQLIREKGADVALRALQALPADVALWLVGDGPYRASLTELAASLGVSDRIRFFGEQWRVETFMQAADCLVCPSVWDEAAGLVNIEALAAGLPVIASRVGGIPELIQDGETGHLFPPGDSGALAQHIGRLRNDPALAARLGRAAREDACARFSIEQRIPDYVVAYDA